MKTFKMNKSGGMDVFDESQKLLVHFTNDELKIISDIQEKDSRVDTLVDRIPEWVDEQIELEGYSFADFNSHLFSNDEISSDEISARILSDEKLIQKIVKEFNEYDDEDIEHDYFKCLDGAIERFVSIEDVMGEILCEKHPKELEIGQWRVRVVEKGDLYGVENRVPWNDEKPLVEFYDMNVDKKDFPEGRFTTGRYYIDKLLNPGLFGSSLEDMVEKNKGFNLNPIYVEWTVQPGDLAVISAWLKAVQKNVGRSVDSIIHNATKESNAIASKQVDKNDFIKE